MMLTRILCIVCCSIVFTVLSVSDFGVSTGSPAYAGGEGGNNANKKTTNSTASQPEETAAAKQKRIKEGLALVDELRTHLEKNAKKNGLGDIVSDLNQLRYLQQNLDKAYALLDGTSERNAPNEVTRALNKMGRSKDKKLKENAKNTKKGMNAHREMWKAQDVGRLYDRALTSGSEKDKLNLKVEYERAVDVFHAAARKLPIELRHFVFQPLPDVPKGTRPKTFK